METLTPRDYLEFRDRLIPASGFQSAQMREIEILLGLDDSVRVPLGRSSYREALKSADGGPSPAARRVEARIADGPSLKQVLYDWLARTPIDGSSSDEAVDRFVERYLAAHRAEIAARTELAEKQTLSEDDRRYFPPYHAAPVVRRAALERHPAVGRALAELAGRIPDTEMRRLNALADVEHQDLAVIARAWLAANLP